MRHYPPHLTLLHYQNSDKWFMLEPHLPHKHHAPVVLFFVIGALQVTLWWWRWRWWFTCFFLSGSSICFVRLFDYKLKVRKWQVVRYSCNIDNDLLSSSHKFTEAIDVHSSKGVSKNRPLPLYPTVSINYWQTASTSVLFKLNTFKMVKIVQFRQQLESEFILSTAVL